MLKLGAITFLMLAAFILASALPGSPGPARADFVLQDTDYPGPGQATEDANNPTATSVYPGPEVPTTAAPAASPTATTLATTATSFPTLTRTAPALATGLTPSVSPTAGSQATFSPSATSSFPSGPITTLIPFPNITIHFPSRTPPGHLSYLRRLPGEEGLPKEGQTPEETRSGGPALVVLAGVWAILGAWFYYSIKRIE